MPRQFLNVQKAFSGSTGQTKINLRERRGQLRENGRPSPYYGSSSGGVATARGLGIASNEVKLLAKAPTRSLGGLGIHRYLPALLLVRGNPGIDWWTKSLGSGVRKKCSWPREPKCCSFLPTNSESLSLSDLASHANALISQSINSSHISQPSCCSSPFLPCDAAIQPVTISGRSDRFSFAR